MQRPLSILFLVISVLPGSLNEGAVDRDEVPRVHIISPAHGSVIRVRTCLTVVALVSQLWRCKDVAALLLVACIKLRVRVHVQVCAKRRKSENADFPRYMDQDHHVSVLAEVSGFPMGMESGCGEFSGLRLPWHE